MAGERQPWPVPHLRIGGLPLATPPRRSFGPGSTSIHPRRAVHEHLFIDDRSLRDEWNLSRDPTSAVALGSEHAVVGSECGAAQVRSLDASAQESLGWIIDNLSR